MAPLRSPASDRQSFGMGHLPDGFSTGGRCRVWLYLTPAGDWWLDVSESAGYVRGGVSQRPTPFSNRTPFTHVRDAVRANYPNHTITVDLNSFIPEGR